MRKTTDDVLSTEVPCINIPLDDLMNLCQVALMQFTKQQLVTMFIGRTGTIEETVTAIINAHTNMRELSREKVQANIKRKFRDRAK